MHLASVYWALGFKVSMVQTNQKQQCHARLLQALDWTLKCVVGNYRKDLRKWICKKQPKAERFHVMECPQAFAAGPCSMAWSTVRCGALALMVERCKKGEALELQVSN